MEYDIKPAASRFHALTVQPEGTVGEFVRSLDVSENSRTTYRKAVLKFLDYLQERGIDAPAAQDILDYKEHLRSLYGPTRQTPISVRSNCSLRMLQTWERIRM